MRCIGHTGGNTICYAIYNISAGDTPIPFTTLLLTKINWNHDTDEWLHRCFPWGVIIHPHLIFNVSLVKLLSKFGYGWVMTCRGLRQMQLLTYVLTPMIYVDSVNLCYQKRPWLLTFTIMIWISYIMISFLMTAHSHWKVGKFDRERCPS